MSGERRQGDESGTTADLWGLPGRLGFVYWIFAALLIASATLPRALVVDGPVLCLFRRITSHPCPGCGLTRSFVAAAHLRLGEAFAHHPFGPLIFAGLLVAVSSRVFLARTGLCWFPGGLGRGAVLQVLGLAWGVWAVFRLAASFAG